MGEQRKREKVAEGREAEIFAWGEGRVIKLFRSTEARRQAEWEAAAMGAAGSAGPLVPATYGVTEVMGRPGLVMERIEGRDLLATVERRPWLVFEVGRILGELHAQLHQVPAPEGLPSLRERIDMGRDSPAVPDDVRDLALALLETLPDGDRLCHLDFHPANVIRSPRGPVVIDWPNASRADPAADVARTLLLVGLGRLPPGSSPVLHVVAAVGRRLMIASYLRAYRRARPLDSSTLRRWGIVGAAVRLTEGIAEERPALLRLVRREMKAQASR